MAETRKSPEDWLLSSETEKERRRFKIFLGYAPGVGKTFSMLRPIIVLSVRDSEAMKVQALDEGADDYLTNPFSIPELLARVRCDRLKGSRP